MNISEERPMDRVGRVFDLVLVRVVQVLLMVMTGTAAIVLSSRVAQTLWTGIQQIDTIPELHHGLQRGFSGALLVLLGLELLDTLKTYFAEHRVRAEVILIVALIAVGRHIIQLDFENAQPGALAGISALTLALTLGLFLVKRAASAGLGPPAEREETGAHR
jgi:uncharacterized membrane protein (DUF373 family)